MPTISAAAYDIHYSGPFDEIAYALSFHGGDVCATIGTLLADITFVEGTVGHHSDWDEHRLHPWLATEL